MPAGIQGPGVSLSATGLEREPSGLAHQWLSFNPSRAGGSRGRNQGNVVQDRGQRSSLRFTVPWRERRGRRGGEGMEGEGTEPKAYGVRWITEEVLLVVFQVLILHEDGQCCLCHCRYRPNWRCGDEVGVCAVGAYLSLSIGD